MYDELVKELRDCADLYRFANTQPEKTFAEQWLAILVTKAADAIEDLNRKEKFHAFLWNTIQPNEMEAYLAMYNAGNEKEKTE